MKLILIFVLIIGSLKAQVLEIPLDKYAFTKFDNTIDSKLTLELQTILNKNKEWKSLIKNKKLCLGVVDISNPDKPISALINGNHMMYAASLPKIAILLAVMDAIDKGELEMTPDLDKLMSDMIRVSSNSSSTALIDLVGYEHIANVLQDERFNFYDEDQHGGLWVGKRYAAGGRRYPEPIKGLSHAATVKQVCRYYYMLAYGKMIDCTRSEQMLSYLHDPHLHHKFVNSLEKVAPLADLYRKSGTWQVYHADSVLVIGDEWRAYILVGLIESPNGEDHMRRILMEVDNLLYKKNFKSK